MTMEPVTSIHANTAKRSPDIDNCQGLLTGLLVAGERPPQPDLVMSNHIDNMRSWWHVIDKRDAQGRTSQTLPATRPITPKSIARKCQVGILVSKMGCQTYILQQCLPDLKSIFRISLSNVLNRRTSKSDLRRAPDEGPNIMFS